jgi:hypothetical protein
MLTKGLLHPSNPQAKSYIDGLLSFLTPYHLKQSTLPQTNPEILNRIKTKVQRRLTSPQHHSKLKVLVFGGSIVEGSGCDFPPPAYMQSNARSKYKKEKYERMQDCAWPHRLQRLADIVLPDTIAIFNLAVGGTHSQSAIPVLEHWLLPDIMKPDGPDIIINAYAANDNLPSAYHNTQNTTRDNFHLYRIFKRLTEFISAASNSRNDCKSPPWIIFLDDYYGNQQESIMGESTLDQALKVILQTTNGAVSYVRPAYMLKHYIWAKSSEHAWSGVWKNKRGIPKVDVHYGTVGHITTAITLAHAIFQWAFDHCQEELLNEGCEDVIDDSPNVPELSELVQIDLPSKEWIVQRQPDLVFPNITETQTARSILSSCQNHPHRHNCVFGFLAAPLGTHSNKNLLQIYIDKFSESNNGWEVQNNFRRGGFQNKLGLVATKPLASLRLLFKKPALSKLTIHYLKSYGYDWKDSRIRGTVQVLRDIEEDASSPSIVSENVFELEGFHEQRVSISYTHVVDNIESSGDGVRLILELVGGATFKINAMMMCG